MNSHFNIPPAGEEEVRDTLLNVPVIAGEKTTGLQTRRNNHGKPDNQSHLFCAVHS